MKDYEYVLHSSTIIPVLKLTTSVNGKLILVTVDKQQIVCDTPIDLFGNVVIH